MKFDTVIGNPPYTRNIDIDFAFTAKSILSKSGVLGFIVPAKWQTYKDNNKGESKHSYKEFRKEIAPYMTNIVYYPDSRDIFNISEHGGISIYIARFNNKNETAIVENRCIRSKYCNNILERDIANQKSLCNNAYCLSNILKLDGSNGFKIEELPRNAKYSLWQGKYAEFGEVVNSGSREGGTTKRNFYKDGSTPGTQLNTITDDDKAPYLVYRKVFSSDNIMEVKSMQSYFNSKLLRFMVFFSFYTSNNILNNETFRYVPELPKDNNGNYILDHEYSDKELYEYYKIPQNYIDIIEGTIRDRK